MVWDDELAKYLCNKCGIILNDKDNVVQIQFGYLIDKGQSFESYAQRPDRHYHSICFEEVV